MTSKKKPARYALYRQVLRLTKKLNVDPSFYKQRYRTATSDYWMQERDALRRAYVQTYRQTRRKKTNPAFMSDLNLNLYKTEISALRNGDLTVREKIHTIPKKQQLDIHTSNLDKIEKQIRYIMGRHMPSKKIRNAEPIKTQLTRIHKKRLKIPDCNMYRLVIEDARGRVISTAVHSPMSKTPERALNALMRQHIKPKAYAYQENEFKIGKIGFHIIKSTKMCGYSRSMQQAHLKWHVVDPKNARTSCMFHSIAACRNWTKSQLFLDVTADGNAKRVQSAKDLKTYINNQLKEQGKPKLGKGGCLDSLQTICNVLKIPIKLYNNIFEETHHFEPAKYNYKTGKPNIAENRYYLNNIKVYEVQRVQNHCHALISKKHIMKHYPDFSFRTFDAPAPDERLEDRIIIKKRIPHAHNLKVASWDIETSPNDKMEHVPYACALAWHENAEIVEKQFWGLDCMKQFLEFIHADQRFNGYTFYAHNGGKYDLPLLIKYALLKNKHWNIIGSACIELNNAWIGFAIQDSNDEGHAIFFKDSARLLPMSLKKACTEFDVKHKKLDETVSHDDITLTNYHTFPALKLYLSHDVKGLLEVMTIFIKDVYDDSKIDVTKCYTGASLAKQTYFSNYYNHKKNPIFTLSDAHDDFCRQGYFGGRVECFKMGNIGQCYYYDFTSLYPSVGINHLPYGKPCEVDFKASTKIDAGFFGFVNCMARTKDKNAIPKHALIKDGRLTFPILENWTQLHGVFSPELDYDMYEYQFQTGLKFQKANFLSKAFVDAFNGKAKAKEDGKPGLSQAKKIIANSLYGFWGLRTKNRDGVEIFSKDSNKYLEYLNSEKLVSIKENEDGTMFGRVLKDLKIRDFNVAIASAISSWARLRLHALLTDIRKAGGELYYCDTDSVICNININEYPELKKEYQWDGDGSELGSLKNECDDVVEDAYKAKKLGLLKKEYVDNVDDAALLKKAKAYAKGKVKTMATSEGGQMYFDCGIITGCKQYGLKKTAWIDGEEKELTVLKCKGYKQDKQKLTYADFVHLNTGGTLEQKQMQFRCPKSNYVSETDEFTITTHYAKKTVKKTYSKGTVDGTGTVVPLRV